MENHYLWKAPITVSILIESKTDIKKYHGHFLKEDENNRITFKPNGKKTIKFDADRLLSLKVVV